ncbi:MAG TPA: hypothetical protein DD738_06390 [Ruminiclostridium sp.]|nr:hypothetical protein [Ruminiclostridium sp.]
MVTLNDIAKKANVSRGTVDRALNNRGGISAKTKLKILKIADELGYKTNNIGKALALQKRLNFGVVIPQDFTPSDNMFMVGALEGIKKAARTYSESGINVEIKHLNDPKVDEIEEGIRYFIDKKVMGIVVLPIFVDKIDLSGIISAINEAVEKNIYVVTIYNDIDNSKRNVFVGTDFNKVGRVGAEFLCKLIGEKGKIAVFSGFESNPMHTVKVLSFAKKVSESFPDVNLTGIYYNNYDEEKAYNTCLKILRSNPDIRGIAVSCGGIAGIIKALKEENCSRKIKVLIFDITAKALEMLKNEDIDAIIGTNIYEQGYNSVNVLYDLFLNRIHDRQKIYSKIDIILKECL